MSSDVIRVVGARQHNLKNLTVEIPRNRLVVITGPSGSGKSSLAFDTLFAEGRRKYVESLSVYARQFLDQMEKPDVDQIEGLSPAIAIEQRGSAANPRSTVATTTEVYDHLRLLYAHLGRAHDPETGEPLVRETTEDIAAAILALDPGTRLMLLAPVVSGDKGEFRDVLERLAREGFVRARVDGEFVELVANRPVRLDPGRKHSVEVVVDRLVIAEGIRPRLMDSLETALRWGHGTVLLLHQGPRTAGSDPGAVAWSERLHATGLRSRRTGRVCELATPQHFSFNSPKGACPVCHGLGQKRVFDAALVVPDGSKSLADGAVHPYRRLGGKRMAGYYQGLLKGLAAHDGVPMDRPWDELPTAFRERLLQGTGGEPVEFWHKHAGVPRKASKPWEGVLPNLERLFAESSSEFTRNRLKAYMTLQPCDACFGRRLRPESLAITLGEGTSVATGPGPAIPGLNIAQFCALPIEAADAFLDSLVLDDWQRQVAGEVLAEIRTRLRFLITVGLGYLTLDRESGTLSGGEAQRIRLATQIGGGLVGVLYILDEPSIGLHQRDNDRLLQTLCRLRDLGNSVVVVEHDEDTIRQADYVLDMGPGAGIRGGEIVSRGTPKEIMADPRSVTGRYLSGDLRIEIPRRRVAPDPQRGWLEVLG
ncbi:MAG: excinuclease ABC subunit UvrA, partial [Verrucomicrobiae bacterium]|nr:excinuclease ABC subunit UvrA [Verrucomicrobiae bacterium]